jgi:hypothetical protein
MHKQSIIGEFPGQEWLFEHDYACSASCSHFCVKNLLIPCFFRGSRTFLSILAGCATGIAGYTGLTGLLCFFLTGLCEYPCLLQFFF